MDTTLLRPALEIRPVELHTPLLTPAAARVTGQVWSLDGGFSAIRPLVK